MLTLSLYGDIIVMCEIQRKENFVMDKVFTKEDLKKYREEHGKVTSFIIPDGVTEIGDDAFRGCYFLESIVIPDSVTKIGANAFENCESLKSVKIPNGVTEIGDYAFYNCHSLKSIDISDSVTKIGKDAFQYCESLESVYIPDGVTEIGDYAFRSCHFLKSVHIPDSVTKIGDEAFWGCQSLESVDIPDSVTEIGNQAFYDGRSLKSIMYKNHNIKPFLNYYIVNNFNSITNFNIIKKLTEHDMLKEDIFPKAVDAALGNKLDEFCSDYHSEKVSRRKKDKLEDRISDAESIVDVSPQSDLSDDYNK